MNCGMKFEENETIIPWTDHVLLDPCCAGGDSSWTPDDVESNGHHLRWSDCRPPPHPPPVNLGPDPFERSQNHREYVAEEVEMENKGHGHHFHARWHLLLLHIVSISALPG